MDSHFREELIKIQPMMAPVSTIFYMQHTKKIQQKDLLPMFELAGVDKDKLYQCLLTMGKKQIRNKKMRAEWSEDNPTRNYCYVVSEWVYNFIAPKGSTSWKLVVEGDPGLHRFIRWPGGKVVDLTAEQFPDYYTQIDYSKAKRCGFMYPSPSYRARLLDYLYNGGTDMDNFEG